MAPVLIPPRRLFIAVLTVFSTVFPSLSASAAPRVTLSWRDNSTNENGFIVERRTDPAGSYAVVGQAARNAISYVDTDVIAGARYCYRVQSFNADGVSPYSNEACSSAGEPSALVSLSISIVGQGAVSSNPAGIACGQTCENEFSVGTTVVLTVVPKPGWQFQGWGGSCVGKTTTCALLLNSGKNVTTTFSQTTVVQPTSPTIGTFRNGAWWIDTGNGKKDSCTVDSCATFGSFGDLPIAGVWTKGGKKQIGIYRKGAWYLDSNGNGRFDGCTGGDSCFSFGDSTQRAVVGDINGDGQTDIGIFRSGIWQFDTGNHRWDGCAIDKCMHLGQIGDQPVVGDWDGDGKDEIGVFRNGTWLLDNGNGRWDGCEIDRCITNFGQAGDLAVVGDWNGDGHSQIGIFRQGSWHLDDGDGKWDTCTVDRCVTGLGTAKDVPLVW